MMDIDETSSASNTDGELDTSGLDKLIIKYIRMKKSNSILEKFKVNYLSDCNDCKSNITSRLNLIDSTLKFVYSSVGNSRSNLIRYKEKNANDEYMLSESDLDELNENSIESFSQASLPHGSYSHFNRRVSKNETKTNRLSSRWTWRDYWSFINDEITDLIIEDYFLAIVKYTAILKLHIQNKIVLDLLSYKTLFYCVDPSLIQQIFDNGLIDPGQSVHIGCLYESQFLFTTFRLVSRELDLELLKKSIMSLTVLIYKTKCSRNRNAIINSLKSDLGDFIYKEGFYQDFKTGMKYMLRALILNGILKNTNLSEFLMSTRTRRSSNSSSDSDDSTSVYSSSMDTMEDEDDDVFDSESSSINELIRNHFLEQIRPMRHQHHRHHHHRNRLRDNEAQNRNQRKFHEILDLPLNEQNIPKEYEKMYPLSLKNLSRIAIKNKMQTYNKINVDKLNVLPRELKKFVCFNDEIDLINKDSEKAVYTLLTLNVQ